MPKKLKKFIPGILISAFSVGIFLLSPGSANAQVGYVIDRVKEGFISAVDSIMATIAVAMITMVAWILSLAGTALDFVIKFTIVDMSQNISNIGTLDQAWGVLRDVANMAFIWILLYIAIATILNLGSGDTKRMLVKVIIIALLINFSLFATKAVIDVSNILAIQFHQSITADSGSLSVAFMQPLGLSSFYNPSGAFDSLTTALSDGADYGQILIFGIMGSIFLLVTALTFFMVAGLLILRYVMLILLMILSPLALAAMVLPKTNEYFSKWFKALIDQAFFAPFFFILAWVVVTLIGGGVGGGAGDFIDVLTKINPDAGFLEANAATVVNFIIIIVLILAALVISKQLSSRSSGQIGEFAEKAGKYTPLGWGRAGIAAIPKGLGYAAKGTAAGAGRQVIRKTGLRKLYEKAGESEFWQGKGKVFGPLANVAMEGTLGALVKKPIAGKSAMDSYKEDKALSTRRTAIREVKQAREEVAKLEKDKTSGVKVDEEELEAARKNLEEKENQLDKAMRNVRTAGLKDSEKEVHNLTEELRELREELAKKGGVPEDISDTPGNPSPPNTNNTPDKPQQDLNTGNKPHTVEPGSERGDVPLEPEDKKYKTGQSKQRWKAQQSDRRRGDVETGE